MCIKLCDDCPLMGDDSDVFEIHLTIETYPLDGDDVFFTRFSEVCRKYLNSKAIWIKNVIRNGTTINDIMTSDVLRGVSYEEVVRVMNAKADFLEAYGYNVIRHKIETPAKNAANCCSEEGYFECHMDVWVPPKSFDKFFFLAKNYNYSISRNESKPGGFYIVTVRDRNMSFETFKELCLRIEGSVLWCLDIFSDKKLYEYAVYDDNEAHDDKWMKN